MGKRKSTSKHPATPASQAQQAPKPTRAAELKNDTANLGYKLRVLLYDLRNVAKDHNSESRTLATTHPTYISGPYFTPEEAELVLNSLVDAHNSEGDDNDNDNGDEDVIGDGAAKTHPNSDLEMEVVVENKKESPNRNGNGNGNKEQSRNEEREERTTKTITVEQAIQDRLAGFFDKRRASGDARPCGPHTMAIIYEEIFNISKTEVEGDDKFLSRLRRCGV